MGIESRNLKIIVLISVINIILSGYLLYTKYSHTSSFCDFSPEVSCDAVSQSPYSEFPANSGIPVSGLGILAFIIFIIPSILIMRTKTPKRVFLGMSKQLLFKLMMLWGVFSLLFYVYLTYLELYVIYAICPLCVVTFLLTIVMFPLLVQNARLKK